MQGGRINFHKILSGEVVKDFAEVDPRMIKAASFAREQSEFLEPPVHCVGGESSAGDDHHSCDRCSAHFPTSKALRTHMLHKHLLKNRIAACTVGNVCPWCSGVFSCRTVAVRHAGASVMRPIGIGTGRGRRVRGASSAPRISATS